MQGVVDLLKSERGVFAIVLVVAATVLVLTGHLTVEDWLAYTKWVGTVIIASKTVTTAVGLLKAGSADVPSGDAPAAPAPSSPAT